LLASTGITYRATTIAVAKLFYPNLKTSSSPIPIPNRIFNLKFNTDRKANPISNCTLTIIRARNLKLRCYLNFPDAKLLR